MKKNNAKWQNITKCFPLRLRIITGISKIRFRIFGVTPEEQFCSMRQSINRGRVYPKKVTHMELILSALIALVSFIPVDTVLDTQVKNPGCDPAIHRCISSVLYKN
jgi:hypothetical protein